MNEITMNEIYNEWNIHENIIYELIIIYNKLFGKDQYLKVIGKMQIFNTLIIFLGQNLLTFLKFCELCIK